MEVIVIIYNIDACVVIWQEISIAANVPQKEIGKYIKILGEALQLSQPINSNSISVHMPRFCTLLQLNKSAQVPLVTSNFMGSTLFCFEILKGFIYTY